MATATNAKRSEFFGVYNTNPSADYAKEVPFRVALRIVGDDEDRWIYGGFFKTEKTAARVYNMMAIRQFGHDAVVNDIGKPTKAQNQEFSDYLNANPARGQMYKVTAKKAQQLIEEFGSFRTHKEVKVGDAQAPEVDGVL